MKRNTLINLALLLLVVLLTLVVVYEPGIDQAERPQPLVQLARDGITHILIRRSGKAEIELERGADGQWQLLRPVNMAASDYRIDSLLRVSSTHSLGSFAATQKPLADFGLDAPAAELQLNHDTRISFGERTPLDHRRYVLLDGTVHLINDTLYYHLIGDYPTFVSPQLLPTGASISALALPELQLAWQEQRWQITPPADDVAPDQVTRLLDNWKHASALQVKRYDGSSGEPLSITLESATGPLQFLLTARTPDLVLARPELDIQYHFPAEAAAQMLGLPEGSAVDSQNAANRVD